MAKYLLATVGYKTYAVIESCIEVFGAEQIGFYTQRRPDMIAHYAKYLIEKIHSDKLPTNAFLASLYKLKTF